MPQYPMTVDAVKKQQQLSALITAFTNRCRATLPLVAVGDIPIHEHIENVRKSAIELAVQCSALMREDHPQ